ncbi:hypothetical protein Cst_c17110 [Thermoclostridium stercorarium subsp. stercorarium DSM 8532]|uniref:Uncharacterized protein n=1 Tax=Thermoclostridium stercorarium (strain ATCC 35414 / DSM 8532 / NCIMB 11754) TaxID=1121335 RepID=L7VT40_THES1|nr:hypothetical protein Cst_c17110 [Thermoclostridium stercorarium subsp. stercorarium DSM 8532]
MLIFPFKLDLRQDEIYTNIFYQRILSKKLSRISNIFCIFYGFQMWVFSTTSLIFC